MPEAWRKRAKKHNEEPKPWKELGCCKACYFAKGTKCKCKCNGKYHGLGLVTKPKDIEDFITLLSLKPLDLDTAEKQCQIIEKALDEHPEWKKLLPRENM